MEKEPFLLKDTVLFIDTWNSFNQNVVAGFSTRQGGVSKEPFHSMNLGLHVNDEKKAVTRNREKLAELIDAPLTTWVCAEQIHGAKIAKVTNKDAGKGSIQMETAIKGVDGLYTRENDTFLFTVYADCVPLYFFAKSQNIIGVAHAGWRGTVANIAGEMVELWKREENISIEDLYVCIGPSIGKCCYVVDDYVIDQVANRLHGEINNHIYEKISSGQYKLDLKQVNVELLKIAGVIPAHIEVSNYCTSCHSNLFFSHRRDQGKAGRMLSFIGMRGA
ncbi:MAG TPA: peptidoglycan editing factor PgeF [Bacillus bacterium]|nr:peptidoglycan editing factor PgeF [Bacillus sp. (in: firmicutes)]